MKASTPIFANEHYSLFADRIVQGSYYARSSSRNNLESNYPKATDHASTDGRSGSVNRWTAPHGISAYPALISDFTLLDALYNLALAELQQDISAAGTFDAGAKWPSVWTRDVSYGILLSLAAIEPRAASASLLCKVRHGRIVQDIGTGGSWPVSTDRLTWGLAAWEIYLTTGDRAWLEQSYIVLRDSMLDDMNAVLDPTTGLAHGESSFLDWRDQTYPQWMQPADIYQSYALGTNAVFYRAAHIMGRMCMELGQPFEFWDGISNRIRNAIERNFWIEAQGLYGQFLYGNVYKSLSPRTDALGQSLALLFNVAPPDRQRRILTTQPVMPFGTPTVFPQSPGIPPYHNDSVWPFVQAFWNLAAAKNGQHAALLEGLAAITRASALFLTNKENFVASTGDAAGTAVNSDRQLWSVAGQLAMTYRVLFGMQFETDGLHLHPVVPKPLAGLRTLHGFRYRDATLTLQIEGFGETIASFLLDGIPGPPIVPPSLTGEHRIEIKLACTQAADAPVRRVPSTFAPQTPQPSATGDDNLHWPPIEGAAAYRIYENGTIAATTTLLEHPMRAGQYTEFQVSAIAESGTESFLSGPTVAGAKTLVIPVAAGPNTPFVEIDHAANTGLEIVATVSAAAFYRVQFRYSNGSGPVNTGNSCALRTLFLDGTPAGPIVMPQRGLGAWDDFGTSSMQLLQIAAGEHRLELRLLPSDENMNGEGNCARIAALLLTPIGPP